MPVVLDLPVRVVSAVVCIILLQSSTTAGLCKLCTTNEMWPKKP